jgi:hypothetical protein
VPTVSVHIGCQEVSIALVAFLQRVIFSERAGKTVAISFERAPFDDQSANVIGSTEALEFSDLLRNVAACSTIRRTHHNEVFRSMQSGFDLSAQRSGHELETVDKNGP